MSKLGLLYDGAGNLTGRVYCSQDDDLALQDAPNVEVAADHEAVTDPGGWLVTIIDDVATLGRRP